MSVGTPPAYVGDVLRNFMNGPRWTLGLVLAAGCQADATPADELPGAGPTTGGQGDVTTGSPGESTAADSNADGTGSSGDGPSGDASSTGGRPTEASSTGDSSDDASDGTGGSTGDTEGPPPDGEPGPWSPQILDEDSVVAGTTSIDVGADGSVHIAYLDVNGGEDQLRYAIWDGDEWSFELVDTGRVGWHCSLRLAPDGTPVVTHYAFSDGDLRYSTRTDEGWVTEVVDADGAVGRKSSLRWTAEGVPRISYHDTSNDDLKLATRSGASWSLEVVDGADATGDYTSLALDSEGAARIAYYRILSQSGDSGGDLRFATETPEGWTLETVDSEGVVGHFVSMALDGDDAAHISYRDDDSGTLKYATQAGDSWSVEIVDADGNLGDFNTALALDGEGRPLVTYYDTDDGALRMATRDRGGWTVEVLDDELFAGHYSSVFVDPAGVAHVSYSFREDDSVNPVGIIGLKYGAHPCPWGGCPRR